MKGGSISPVTRNIKITIPWKTLRLVSTSKRAAKRVWRVRPEIRIPAQERRIKRRVSAAPTEPAVKQYPEPGDRWSMILWYQDCPQKI